MFCRIVIFLNSLNIYDKVVIYIYYLNIKKYRIFFESMKRFIVYIIEVFVMYRVVLSRFRMVVESKGSWLFGVFIVVRVGFGWGFFRKVGVGVGWCEVLVGVKVGVFGFFC